MPPTPTMLKPCIWKRRSNPTVSAAPAFFGPVEAPIPTAGSMSHTPAISLGDRRFLQWQAGLTSFLALFSVVGLALYGLPFYYDYMVTELGWSRTMVTSGNALSKLLVGPPFGFFAGWIVDRFGPRRLMLAGILMAGGALIGLGNVSTSAMFYFF